MLIKRQLSYDEFNSIFSPVFGDDLDLAFDNVKNNIFEIYTSESLNIIVEFIHNKKELYVVGQIGVNSQGVWDAVYNYMNSIGYDVIFKVFKPSQLRLQRRFNPVYIGDDRSGLKIYKVYCNG